MSEETDLYELIKEKARGDETFVMPLKEPCLRIGLKPMDALSIEMLEFITEKYPDITTRELIEQLQNAIWWMYTIDVVGHQKALRESKDRESATGRIISFVKTHMGQR